MGSPPRWRILTCANRSAILEIWCVNWKPLSLPERQHVMVTIDDSAPVAAEEINHRYAEQAWLGAHAHEYIGQWVALDAGTLVSHGPNAVPVRDEARSRGGACPFVVRIPLDFGGRSAGWL